MPEENVHLCPACEDDASEARAVVFKSMGISAAVTPVVLVFLTFFAAINQIELKIDDRLVMAMIAAYAAVVAAMFKKK